jgi:hypothetical protein
MMTNEQRMVEAIERVEDNEKQWLKEKGIIIEKRSAFSLIEMVWLQSQIAMSNQQWCRLTTLTECLERLFTEQVRLYRKIATMKGKRGWDK